MIQCCKHQEPQAGPSTVIQSKAITEHNKSSHIEAKMVQCYVLFLISADEKNPGQPSSEQQQRGRWISWA